MMNKKSFKYKYFRDIVTGTMLSADINESGNFKSYKKTIKIDRHLSIEKDIIKLIAAFSYCLYCFTSEEDIVFSLVCSNTNENKLLPFRIFCDFKNNEEFLNKHKSYFQLVNKVDPEEIEDIYKNEDLLGMTSILIEDANYSSQKNRLKFDHNPSFLLRVQICDKKMTLELSSSNNHSEQTINNFLFAYEKFFLALAGNKEIKQIDYISDEELCILDKNNHSEVDLQYSDVLEAYNYQIENHTNNKCVRYKDTCFTYGQSSIIVSGIIDILKANKVNQNSKVAIFLPRSCWYLLAPLAILSLGATYVAVDINYPKERVEHMLKDTKPDVILISDKSIEACKNLEDQIDNFPKTVNLTTLNIKILLKKGRYTKIDYCKVEKKHPACIVYTSGSTGIPKGSIITRLALINLSEWYIQFTKMTSKDIYGMYSSFVFDMHAMAIWPSCVCGALVDIIPEDRRININSLNNYFYEHKITHTFITTQVAKHYAQTVTSSNLTVLFAAGEALRSVNKLANFTMYDGYGPCENLALSSAINIDDRLINSSVGFVNNNVKAYILDANGHRVPFGAVGELYLSGYQVALAYLNRDKETKKAFFKNKFDGSMQGYESMYKTGDIVKWLADGSIGFVRRNDNQVKIRGNRVELSEIEDCIRQSKYIEDVTVQTFNKDGNNDIVAYIVLSKIASDKSVFTTKLELFNYVTKYIAKRKPDYMIPTYVVEIDSIPLNVNSKVDKDALPKPNVDHLQKKYVAPRSSLEKNIVEAFSHALDIKKLGIDDNFISLGGSSLLAMQLFAFDVFINNNVLIQNIFDYPTPRLLAEFIENNKAKNDDFLSRGIADYNYEPLHSYLLNNKQNAQNNIINIKKSNVKNLGGNIIITGVSGFLGIHVLKEFLDNYNGIAYCIIRPSKKFNAKQRLNNLFFYYFDVLIDEEYKNRIVVLEGDLNDKALCLEIKKTDADTIINCAACISYYKEYEYMYENNVETVNKLIDICLRSNKKLIQISTISIYGSGKANDPNYLLDEGGLFYGQQFLSSYNNTKFIAERNILQAIVDKNLDAKIIRLGNITGRFKDGMSQINLFNNAFLLVFWAFNVLSSISKNESQNNIEFSPVDYSANAILKIANTKEELTVWHVFNNKVIPVYKVINVLDKLNIKWNIVSKKVLIDTFRKATNSNNEKTNMLEITLYPLVFQKYDIFEKNHMDYKLSLEILNKFDFDWPEVSNEYLYSLFNYLKNLGFFD